MNKEEIEKAILTLEVLIDCNKEDGTFYNAQKEWEALEVFKKLQQKVNQLETNIKDSIERHKETIQDTKDFYRPLEDTIYSGSTLIELAETHIEILERGKK